MMIKVSACVIVKNEAKNLPRWLENMQAIADELVVVDTGSTDNTADLARAAGARVISYAWRDDFAAAKNCALDAAQGEWILFLDADEYFSPRSLPRVREYIRKYQHQPQVVGFICRLINIDSDRQDYFLNETCQARVFRNLPTLRYRGRVHEGLYDCVAGRHMEPAAALEIYHTGYSSSIFRAKSERNLRLLENEIAQDGEKPEHWIYLMKCWYGLEDYEKSLFYAQKAIDAGFSFIGGETAPYEMYINSLDCLHRPMREILQAVDRAIARFPRRAEFYFFRGIFLWRDKDYLQSRQAFERGLELYAAGRREREAGVPDNATGLLPQVWYELGRIHWLRGDKAAAAQSFLQGLQVYPYTAETLLGLYDCIAGEAAEDLLQLLNSLYDRKKDAAFLAEVLSKRQAGKVWLYYAGLAGEPLDTVKAYLAAGKYGAAATARSFSLDGIQRLGLVSAWEQQHKPGGPLLLLLPAQYRQAWANPAQGDNGVAAAASRAWDALVPARKKQLEEKPAELIRQAAERFANGQRKEAVADLLAAYCRRAGNPELAYGLAVLLQLSGALEQARKVLLSASHATDAIRELWTELQADDEYPLVSILIPTYNRPGYFQQALQSALAQTYTNVEIIVCDNSTDDRTEKLMEDYRENLRVKYLRNREAKSKAANFQPFAVLAGGEYLQWLMDDDILCPDKLAKMVPLLKQRPEIRLVTSARSWIDAAGRLLPQGGNSIPEIRGEYALFDGIETGRLLLKTTQNFLGEPSAVLFRRHDLQHHYWQADCRGYQTISDVVMWLELLEQGQCAYFKEPLSCYRRHMDQEGQRMDVVLLSRIEWKDLIQEYHDRGVFLCSEADYRTALDSLYQDAAVLRAGPRYGEAAADRRRQYEACMAAIPALLEASRKQGGHTEQPEG